MMKLAEREAQIIRIQADPTESDVVRELHETLKREVLLMSQSVIEVALIEELLAERQHIPGPHPCRSGYFSRTLDMERGLDPKAVELVVSDGSSGLPTAMGHYLPNAKQQRCTTHKVHLV